MGPLEGQVAVITGGAGGIGWASALEWLSRDGKVVLADLPSQQAKAEQLIKEGGFDGSQPSAVFVAVDTRNSSDLESCAAAAAELGKLTCWFNNAGFALPGDDADAIRMQGLSPELRNMIEVNTLSHINGAGVAMRAFEAHGTGGVVVSTASMAGILPLGAPPVYSASKAAVVHFTRAMGLTLGEDSAIRFYCLCPSYTATSQGPPIGHIRASVGGVLQASHMGIGFILLAAPASGQSVPNGSVMRVTVRKRGAEVVHDIVEYGREFGGEARPRDGVILRRALLETLSDAEAVQLDAANEAGRSHEGMRTGITARPKM